MEFVGRLYYDIVSPDVWQFFRMVVAAQREGVAVGLEWKPYLADGIPDGDLTGEARVLAAAELVRQDVPMRHGAFVPAVLTAIHHERTTPDDPQLIDLAARVADIEAEVVSDDAIAGPGRVLLAASQAEAEALGVDAVPTLYRHGPVLTVRTTGAASMDGVAARLETIDRVLSDDGLWELRKP